MPEPRGLPAAALVCALALACGDGQAPRREMADAARSDAQTADARAVDARAGADAAMCPICEHLLRCCMAANAANTCDPPCGIVEGQLQMCRAGGGGGLDPAALEGACAHSLSLYQQNRPELAACQGG